MAPLPSFLFDNYKRYKEDTNRVVTWLVETSRERGHPLKDQFQTPRVSSGRLKGKHRKQAREEAKAGKETIAPTRSTITVNQFIDLAEWIANLKPRVKLPSAIVNHLRSALALRKRCTEWFQKNRSEEELVLDNMNHSYFIGVLERVLQILEPNSTSETVVSGQKNKYVKKFVSEHTSQAEINELTNIYNILSVDDSKALDDGEATIITTVKPLTQNVHSRKATPPPPPRNNIYEIERTIEEFVLAFYCFFHDVEELRGYIRSLWLQYKNGTLDLMTASVTTNTAVNLVGCIEDDLHETFSTLESTRDVLNKVFTRMNGENSPTFEGMGTVNHSTNKRRELVVRSNSIHPNALLQYDRGTQLKE